MHGTALVLIEGTAALVGSGAFVTFHSIRHISCVPFLFMVTTAFYSTLSYDRSPPSKINIQHFHHILLTTLSATLIRQSKEWSNSSVHHPLK